MSEAGHGPEHRARREADEVNSEAQPAADDQSLRRAIVERLTVVSDALPEETRLRVLVALVLPVGGPIFIVGFVTIALAFAVLDLPEAAKPLFPFITIGGASVVTFLILVRIYRRLPDSVRRMIVGPRR